MGLTLQQQYEKGEYTFTMFQKRAPAIQVMMPVKADGDSPFTYGANGWLAYDTPIYLKEQLRDILFPFSTQDKRWQPLMMEMHREKFASLEWLAGQLSHYGIPFQQSAGTEALSVKLVSAFRNKEASPQN